MRGVCFGKMSGPKSLPLPKSWQCFFAFKTGNAFKTTGEVSDIDDFNVMVLAGFPLGFSWFSVGNAITMDGQTL